MKNFKKLLELYTNNTIIILIITWYLLVNTLTSLTIYIKSINNTDSLRKLKKAN